MRRFRLEEGTVHAAWRGWKVWRASSRSWRAWRNWRNWRDALLALAAALCCGGCSRLAMVRFSGCTFYVSPCAGATNGAPAAVGIVQNVSPQGGAAVSPSVPVSLSEGQP